MKWFLILCFVTLAASANYPARSPCQKQNIDLVRQNADNLLYLEYMRKQAQGDDEWQSLMGSDEYQQRLNELRSVNTGCGAVETPCGESSCGSEFYGDKVAVFQSELKRQKMMIQRLYSQLLSQSTSCGSKKLKKI
jgi:hypothetical protein